MLISQPTRYGAGIEIFGDYKDLESLQETIHRLSEEPPIEGTSLSDFVLGLAYDLRHAYQGDRLEETFNFSPGNSSKYRGTQVLWPIVIAQVAFLRWAAAYRLTSRLDQANLFLLEHCVEDSLTKYDPVAGAKAFAARRVLYEPCNDYYTQFILEVSGQYVRVGKDGKVRFRRLPDTILSMSWMSKEYRGFADSIETMAREANTSPHELHDMSAMPDFRW